MPHNAVPPTPAFVIDLPALNQLLGDFQGALEKHWPNSILSYSFKTNSLPWLVSYMRTQNVWAEVVSDTEYELALALDYTADQVIYNGPIKSRDRLRSALLEGSIVNLDAKREIEWTAELAREMPDKDFGVGLRVNWELEEYCPGESGAHGEASRFGFDRKNGELDQAIADLKDAGVRVAGIHLHRASTTQSLGVFRAVATVAAELIAAHDLHLDWVDVGGGFFGSLDRSPSFDEYVSTIKEVLEPVVDINHTRLIVEPGGALVAVPLEFHASVIDVKEIDSETIVVTDASRTNIDPLFRRKRPFKTSLETKSTELRDEQVIVGFTCMEDDRIMKLENAPALEVGDTITFYIVGGYTMSFQPLFIQFLPPVYVRDNDSLTPVRRQWGVNDFLQGNEWIGADGTTAGSF
ncbi:hypothetical protein [Corynebacterium lubricantis]|uniref:hypothetical protein n=1 Tax=Corynebacterium lubricantis TaxID=541095 RepID=UPI00035DC494|nr:hypothetical protein [Corynebacterium lubricantis]